MTGDKLLSFFNVATTTEPPLLWTDRGESRLSDKKSVMVRIKALIISNLPIYFAVITVVIVTYDAVYLIPAVATLAFATTLSFMTNGKSDMFLSALVAFMISIFFANWFFDDMKKTLAFPLAYIFYRLGKHMCPDFMQNAFMAMEKALFGRSLSGTKSEMQKPHAAIKKRNPICRRRAVNIRSPKAKKHLCNYGFRVNTLRAKPCHDKMVDSQRA